MENIPAADPLVNTEPLNSEDDHYWRRWWRCPECNFPVRDDGGAEAAAQIAGHVDEHAVDKDAPSPRERKSEQKRGAR